MSTVSDIKPAVPPNRHSRSTVVTFLGAVVRPLGSWMPIAGTVDLPGANVSVLVGELDTVLVAGDCATNPSGPGC